MTMVDTTNETCTEQNAAPSPAATADRVARLVDELAGLVTEAMAALVWQAFKLDTATGPHAGVDQATVAAAAQVSRRVMGSLSLVADSLGEVHVTCDQLAHDLRSIHTHTAGVAAREVAGCLGEPSSPGRPAGPDSNGDLG